MNLRFKKRRDLGKKFDPLVLEDLEWNNEWIVDIENRFWVWWIWLRVHRMHLRDTVFQRELEVVPLLSILDATLVHHMIMMMKKGKMKTILLMMMRKWKMINLYQPI